MDKASGRIQTWFKIIGAAIVIITMAVSQFHNPIILIPKEMWTIISAILTYIFMGMFPEVKIIMPGYGEIVKGSITVILLIMISLSIYLKIDVGREWWSLVRAAIAFTYGGK